MHLLTPIINHYNLQVTDEQITDNIVAHYDYPSIESFAEGLENIGFQTMAVRITKERLDNVPFPTIMHLHNDMLVCVTHYAGDSITYTTGKKQTKENIADFEKKWSGVALLIQPTDKIPPQKTDILSKKNILFVLYILLGASIISAISFTNIPILLLGFCKIIGLGVSVALLSLSISKNSYFQKLCKVNKNTDCEGVLQSSASQITDWLSWSDMGFFYFGGGFLAWFFLQNKVEILGYFWILNVLTLPYTFFSVYYQWRIAKQWCLFCLLVQVIFWLEFVVLWKSWQYITLDLYVLSILGFSFLMPMCIWLLLNKTLQDANTTKQWKIKALCLQNNPKIFEALLHKQKTLSLPPEYNFVLLGNTETDKQITIFTNLHCKPCATAHQKIMSLLETEDLQIKFCFLSFEGKENTTQYFLNLYKEISQEDFEKILDEWYLAKSKNLAEFAQKYPLKNPTENYHLLENHNAIAQLNDINQTPTIFLQGYLLPENYSWNSLLYLIKKI